MPRCNCRRKAPTYLRCSRCDSPICPDCQVNAPVGMFCRECANQRRSPLFEVSASSLLLASVACLVAATFGGWLLTSVGLSFGFFGFFIASFYGMGVAEVALRTTGRKRGPRVEILAGATAALGILFGAVLGALPFGSLLVAYLMHRYLINPFFYIGLVIAVVSAVNRVRYL
jgi:MFS family permease